MKIRIGVGITRVHKINEQLKSEWQKTEPLMQDTDEFEFIFCPHIDNEYGERKGVAKSKNFCLRFLINNNCQHIFLFDDDAYPRHPDWYKVFIDSAKAMGQHHLSYIPNKGHLMGKLSDKTKGLLFGELVKYDYAWGCMMYFTRHCIETAGGYNEDFEVYGYEHCELSCRIHNMGLTAFPYLTIKDVTKYIYSCNFEGFPEGLEPETHSLDGLNMKPILYKNEQLFRKMYKSDKKISL